MIMTIKEQQDEIIADFELFGDWMEKYEYIIQLGKELPLIEAKYKLDENLIRGCQSRVWLHADYKDGRLFFTADSDAVITKGLVSLVGLVYEVKIGDKGDVKITMTLTAPACPAAGEIVHDVQQKIEALEGVLDCHVQLTFDPPWTKEMMSEEAKLELGFL